MNLTGLNVAIVTACDDEWGIGKDGKIPWYYTEDFKFFKKITEGGVCFMGRTTYEELAGMRHGKEELLPGRKCVIFTRGELNDPRVDVCNNIHEWIEHTGIDNFFIGGSSVYEFALSVANVVYMTNIPGDHKCDVKFPSGKLKNNFEIVGDILLPGGDLIVDKYVRVRK
jgi:dihydrofolate reductase